MQIWPAIDIRDGKCVRLVPGNFARETIDPVALTSATREPGLRVLKWRLHISLQRAQAKKKPPGGPCLRCGLAFPRQDATARNFKKFPAVPGSGAVRLNSGTKGQTLPDPRCDQPGSVFFNELPAESTRPPSSRENPCLTPD
jgi:hypothetical protein